MALKRELISIIRNILPREDKTGKYHEEVIGAAIGVVYARMLNEIFAENPKELDNYTITYGVTSPLTVVEEAATEMYYTTLPISYIPFSDKASGVRRVDAVIQGGNIFYPMDAREADLALNGSMFYQAANKIGYVVKRTRIEYFNMKAAVITSGVRLDIVPEFSAMDEDDVVKLPYGKETDLIAGTLEILGVIPPVDLRDNNADLKREQ
jgi:hypothetical protein